MTAPTTRAELRGVSNLQAYSPKGVLIVGTYEMCPCRAEIQPGSFYRDEKGELQFEWAGETEMFYDGQQAVERDGQTVYLDEEGNEWLESELELKELEP